MRRRVSSTFPPEIGPASAQAAAVVLFDGTCNLCNGWVQFLLRRDARRRFRFASLQSSAGEALARSHGLPAGMVASVVVIDGDRAYLRSSAVLRICRALPGLWPALSVLALVPVSLRDRVYDWVAANRYRWFGRRERCWLPAGEWRDRFLE
jgi:predicted DCC family thiol-disulfide oxidoreductase YuxK